MLIAGDFTRVNNVTRSSIARIDAAGNLDENFNVTVNGTVRQVILLNPSQADSQILILGEFTIDSSGGPYYGLARLNSNGTVDTGFAHTFQYPMGVNAMGIQMVSGSLYTILVGGYCMGIGDGNNTYYLLRLNMNGGLLTGNPMDLKRSDPAAYVRNVLIDLTSQKARLCATVPRLPDRSHVDYLLS